MSISATWIDSPASAEETVLLIDMPQTTEADLYDAWATNPEDIRTKKADAFQMLILASLRRYWTPSFSLYPTNSPLALRLNALVS
jgi:hypothetical protein